MINKEEFSTIRFFFSFSNSENVSCVICEKLNEIMNIRVLKEVSYQYLK